MRHRRRPTAPHGSTLGTPRFVFFLFLRVKIQVFSIDLRKEKRKAGTVRAQKRAATMLRLPMDD